MRNSEKFWDRISKNDDNSDQKQDQNYIDTVENTKKYLNKSDEVLDFACGSGKLSSEFSGDVKMIHAIDFSAKTIAVAKRKASVAHIDNITFSKLTIFDKELIDSSFDVILSFNIFHLLEKNQKYMQRINKLLKPGGIFISVTPCMGEKKSFMRIALSILGKLRLLPDLNFFKTSELDGLIANENFQIIEIINFSNSPLNHFVVAKKSLKT